MSLINKVQLITYPDSLGDNLKGLKTLLEGAFEGLFDGGVHILPPFPSSGDRGFAPLTYLEIEPNFGDWNDIRDIANEGPLLLDLMVNHISQQSPFFQDYLQHGEKSVWSDLFLKPESIWEEGVVPESDLDKIFLRRNIPYSTFECQDTGEKFTVWTTFGKTTPSEQIDLNVNSDTTRKLFETFFENFANNGIKIIRLDAVGYVIKKPGTSCFFVEPEISEFVSWVKSVADRHEIEILPEVHSHHSIQEALSDAGYWIYDFILPYRVLDTLLSLDATELLNYLRERPVKQFTMLDCHDGIPVKPDLDGLVSSSRAQAVVDQCLDRGANLSKVFSQKHCDADGFDVHQIRGSFYSMLNDDDDAYVIARAIQLFTPGIPQIYYVGLLAGRNDFDRVAETGEGREINRHNYSIKEVLEEMERPVVKRILQLIRIRNEHPAFQGDFEVCEDERYDIHLQWKNGNHQCALTVDLKTMKSFIYSDDSTEVLSPIEI